jgi:hypothetical protein
VETNRHRKFLRFQRVFIICTICIFLLSHNSTSQGRVLINEYLSWPSNGCNVTSEYIELFNFGPGPVNIGCYIITDGDYAITIPANTIIQPGQYFVIAGQDNLPIGCGNISASTTVNLNWNTCNCTSGAIPATGDGFFTDGGSGSEQVVLFDPNLNVIDAIVRDIVEPSSLITTSTVAGTCSSQSFDLDNMAINYERVGESQGRGNSFARLTNGGCGWLKDPQQSAGAVNNTPGPQSYNANITITSSNTCTNTGAVSVNITGSNISQIFPMKYTLARDVDSNGVYNFSDAYLNGTDSTPSSITIGGLVEGRYRVVIETANGCDLKSFDFIILNCNNIVLPAYFNYFNLSALQNKIILQWQIGGNEPIDKFEIQKSADGINFYSASMLENIPASDRSFSYIDSPAQAMMFYKIKLFTKSGRILNSSVQSHSAAPTYYFNTKVFPNPAINFVTLETESSTASQGWVEMRSPQNSLLKKIDLKFISGKNEHRIAVDFLSPGAYFFRVYSGNNSIIRTLRVIKQ